MEPPNAGPNRPLAISVWQQAADPRDLDQITEIGLRHEVIYSLHRSQIWTIRDLIRRCEGEILAIKGIGRKSFRIIHEAVTSRGYKFCEWPEVLTRSL